MRIPVRIESKIRRLRGEDGCWVWTGAHLPNGYGALGNWNGQSQVGAHRVLYELAYGAIPEGHHVHHTCGRRDCVRPSHLRAIRPQDHQITHQRVPVTHCKHGHEYTPENTLWRADGRRRCRTCGKRWQQEKRARRRAERDAS